MSVARALATNTIAQVAGKAISIAIGVAVVAILTRLLGVEGFGKYSTANAFLGVFAILLDLGTNVLLIQMLGEHKGDEKEERRIVSAFLTLRTIAGIVILTIAVGIAWIIPSYDHEIRLATAALWASFLFTVLNQVVIGVHQRHLKTHIVAIAEVVGRLVLLAGVLIAVWQGWGLLPVVLIVSLGGTINFIINAVLAYRLTPFYWEVDWAFWKRILIRAWPIGVSILASLIYFRADMLIIGWFRSQAEVGIYAGAYRVLEILVSLPFLFAGILLPLLARAWKDKQKEAFHAFVQNGFNAMVIITIPLMLGTQAVATQVMTLIGDTDFAASGGILQILIVATGAIFIATIFSHAIIALDAQKDMLPWYIWTAIFAAIGYAFLIPRYGIWAAAWLTLASEAVILLGNILVTQRRADMRLDWTIAARALVAALLMLLVVTSLAETSWPLAIVAGIITYTGLVLVVKAVTPDMLRLLFKR
jgi:O-antigen/teichoic acid export membrane protein